MKILDTISYYETPEGIVLRLITAGPVPRACAWLIDLLIKTGIYAVFGIALAILSDLGMGIYMILLFFMEWFYPVVCEVTWGATPGKKAMDLRVIHDNGSPVSFSASTLRNLLRAADFLPLCYGVGLFSMMINKDFKRLGDLAAGTLVVHHLTDKKPIKLYDTKPIQPPDDLRVNEQRTLLDFYERSQTLSRERCIELSDLLEPITGKKGQEALSEVMGYGHWVFKGKSP